ncbi:WGR domain-containing protein [Planctomycetota bacterium]
MASITLYRIDQDKNMRRFYRIDVQKDLFGVWMLTREWGRIGRSGQKLIHSFQSELEAEKVMHQYQSWKQRRGYSECQAES